MNYIAQKTLSQLNGRKHTILMTKGDVITQKTYNKLAPRLQEYYIPVGMDALIQKIQNNEEIKSTQKKIKPPQDKNSIVSSAWGDNWNGEF